MTADGPPAADPPDPATPADEQDPRPPGGPPGPPPADRAPDPLHDIELLLRSRYALLVLRTPEERRAESLLRHVADRRDLPLFTWSPARGLRRDGRRDPIYGTSDPAGALDHVAAARIPALYHFRGLGPYLGDREISARLAVAAGPFEDRDGALVLTGEDVTLPPAATLLSATVDLPPPDADELRRLLHRIVRDLRRRGRVEVDLGPEGEARLVRSLAGLTLLEAEKVLTRAVVEDGRLSVEDLREVVRAKRRIVEREGLLEYYPAEETLGEVADLARLKEWLRKRSEIVMDPDRAEEFGLPFPRGLLLLGVPGCGKSLCARAVASEWGLPLLKLDPSNLYNKYVGESERNFKRAVATAQRTAPVVLWIDEIEKAFATSGEGDGGLSLRILGSFLSWLQERRGDVFVVATANDVTRLPPELLRKGRFDETFFVDLPDEPTRREILRIHLEKRGHDPTGFDLEALAAETDGFSGSELEGIVVAGLYTAFAGDRELDTGTLLDEARRTRPLSTTMAERIAALRDWARGRTVPAH